MRSLQQTPYSASRCVRAQYWHASHLRTGPGGLITQCAYRGGKQEPYEEHVLSEVVLLHHPLQMTKDLICYGESLANAGRHREPILRVDECNGGATDRYAPRRRLSTQLRCAMSLDCARLMPPHPGRADGAPAEGRRVASACAGQRAGPSRSAALHAASRRSLFGTRCVGFVLYTARHSHPLMASPR